MAADTGPRYRLDRPLGEGGMGVVHLGTQVSAAGERLVAIKRLAGRAEVDAVARARLVAEARLVFQLTYANICQVFDLGENQDGTFIVMEYVRGDDLAGLLERVEAGGARLDVAASVYVAREVARALDYAHRRVDPAGRPLGLVHGDVKPSNILLSVEGEVKLADFGIARGLRGASPGTGVLGGTPGYMAPEVRAGTLDHRADIYSLGATLVRALLGRRIDDSSLVLAELAGVPDVPVDLVAVVARSLAFDRGARWLSAAELERALSTWLARRHPEFTPWVLADLVRRHPRACDATPRPATQTPEGATIAFDMHTLLELDGAEPRSDAAVAAAAPERAPDRPRTATAAAPKGSWWWRALRPWPLVGLVALVAAAGAVFAADRGRSSAQGAELAATGLAIVDAGVKATSAPPAPVHAAEPSPPTVAAEGPRRRARRRATPPVAEPAAVGYLTVSSVPWGSVLVDGKRVADETPAYRVAVPAGRHLVVVRFGDSGERSAPQSVVVDPGQHRTLGFRR
jgi:hypothetical protein